MALIDRSNPSLFERLRRNLRKHLSKKDPQNLGNKNSETHHTGSSQTCGYPGKCCKED